MRKLLPLSLLVVALVGCSGESAEEKALDTAAPTANMPAPPPPANKQRPQKPGNAAAPIGPASK